MTIVEEWASRSPDPDRFRRLAEEGRANPSGGQARESDEERAEREARQRQGALAEAERRRQRYQDAVPERFQSASLDDLDDSQSPQVLLEWLESPATTLVLHGAIGSGKTHALYAVCNRATASGLWVEAHDVAGLIDDLRRDTLEGDLMARVADCDILALDDLGVERVNEFAAEAMQRIIDDRWKRARRLVVSTNLRAAEIEHRYGQRLTDRLLDGATLVDYRSLPSRRLDF